jgi:hypothetical protein
MRVLYFVIVCEEVRSADQAGVDVNVDEEAKARLEEDLQLFINRNNRGSNPVGFKIYRQ